MRLRRCQVHPFFSLLPALFIVLIAAQGLAADVPLSWDPSLSANIIGYRVYVGGSSRIYNAPITIGNQVGYTVTGLTDGTWFFAVTAFDVEGNESDYSNEVSRTVGTNPDATPLTISGVSSLGVTNSSATIVWTTNRVSNTQVEYGTSTYYGSIALNSSMVTSHSVTLTGLSAGASYHYRVKSTDAAGNLVVSGDCTFVAAAPTDTTPPAISGVTVSNVTGTGARIAWATDEASDTLVEFGETMSYGRNSALDTMRVTAHAQSLAGLASETLYHFRVKSRDVAGNLSMSGDYAFTTSAPPDTAPPVISGISVSNVTSSGATITWNTNEASNSQVEYSTTSTYGNTIAVDSSMVTTHSQTLSGLAAGTQYYFRVKSADAAGNALLSPSYIFTTAADSNADSARFSQWLRNDAIAQTTQRNLKPVSPTTYKSAQSSKSSNLFLGSVGTIGLKQMSIMPKRSRMDKTPPQMREIAATQILATSATIQWVTNEDADGEVEYGLTRNYGRRVVDGSPTTDHRQTLTGLRAGTLYHYRVKSRDDAGNLAISRDSVFTTSADSAAPVISMVSVADVTHQSALISWNTDKPSSSEVEYWSASGSTNTALLSTFGTQHSMMLNNLDKETSYQFRVKASDPYDNQSTSPEYSFITRADGYAMAATPRFFDAQNQNELAAEVLVGVSLTNRSEEPAVVAFSAVDTNGFLITGQDIVNPNGFEVNAQAQSTLFDAELFGNGLEGANSKGWVKSESSASRMKGISLVFDSKLSFMDGTGLADAPMTNFAFTEIQMDGNTRIDVANSSREPVAVEFDLVKADGSIRGSQSRLISGNGALVTDLYGDVFSGIAPEASDYVRVSAAKGLLSFELMQKELGDIALLPGMDLTSGSTVLYSPHYVVGSEWKTTLSVINLDAKAGTVQCQFLGENGVQIGSVRTLSIPANGKLYIEDQDFFRQGTDGIYTGFVKVVSDGVRLAGSTVYGDRSGISFSSALPLVGNLQKSMLYGHAVSNDLYAMGIAIVNPNDTDVMATLEIYAADGTRMDRKDEYVRAGQRKAKLLVEYFPSLRGQDQTSGYIRVVSEKPLASFSLFGTGNLSVLSPIPAQATR